MSDPKERLICHLADLMGVQEARMMASDTGLSEREIDFSGPSVVVWRSIFQQAVKEGRVADLIDITNDRYPISEILREARAAIAADPACFGTLRDLDALKVELIARLADTFVDHKIARTIASHAQLSLGNVDFDGRPIVTWTSLVEEAVRQRRLTQLVHAAKRVASIEDDPLFDEVCGILEHDAQAFDAVKRSR